MEVCPIADLNPGERRWVIKCRVTRKIPINNHPKDRGKGQIIYVDLKDASVSSAFAKTCMQCVCMYITFFL